MCKFVLIVLGFIINGSQVFLMEFGKLAPSEGLPISKYFLEKKY